MKIAHVLLAVAMIVFAILWYIDLIAEPMFAILETTTGLILLLLPRNGGSDEKSNLIQQHFGKGDNVGKNKVTK